MKVMTIVGTRPEIIRLSETIKVLDRLFDHTLVHTGQNYDYELNQVFFEELGLRKPDFFLEAAGANAIETIARVMTGTDRVMAELRPEALLILGDTNSALAAYPAKRRHIPIFHMEAGNRCFDFRVPEEINRRIVDHISDINLTYTEHARRYLLAEGLPPDRVIKTGSPMKEVILHHREAIAASDMVTRLGLEKGNYFVASVHREENVDQPERLGALTETLNAVSRHYGCEIFFSVHPRTAKRLAEHGLNPDSAVRQIKPLGFIDYIALQQAAKCVLSDSGTITEESSLLGFPAVTLRQAHERPEGMDEGTVVLCDLIPDRVIEAVGVAIAQLAHYGPPRTVDDYQVDQVSWKVAKIIMGYTDYVRREVWKKGISNGQ
ncbi:non-hydrolyzing UDP-N-acetylglucosamine 2-epimerase [Methylococcus capsulatus]|uniref:non-hydrolyzing UDP-N-acetylglucosamine 2-epimerase n=1 Tax=Methylococcus capsulatus TaxID=414 RepID=UPI002FD8BA14